VFKSVEAHPAINGYQKVFLMGSGKSWFFRAFLTFNEAELIFFVGAVRAHRLHRVALDVSSQFRYQTSIVSAQTFLAHPFAQSSFFAKNTAKF
jgi:hypothetical protein